MGLSMFNSHLPSFQHWYGGESLAVLHYCHSVANQQPVSCMCLRFVQRLAVIFCMANHISTWLEKDLTERMVGNGLLNCAGNVCTISCPFICAVGNRTKSLILDFRISVYLIKMKLKGTKNTHFSTQYCRRKKMVIRFFQMQFGVVTSLGLWIQIGGYSKK